MKNDFQTVMMAMAVEAAINAQFEFMKLIDKYEEEGKDLVPLSELNQIISNSVASVMDDEDSITNKIMKEV